MYKTSNLYQNDPQWKDVPLGNQTSETIGTWGCLLTSMTMMLNGVGYSETPDSVNQKMKDYGGFLDALVIPAVLPQAFPNVTYIDLEPCESRPAPLDRIDAALSAGKPVIVQVDWNPAAGVQTHWILLKERKGGDYVMYDPYQYRGDSPDKELLMTDRYKHQGTDPKNAISAVLWFEVSAATPPPPPPPKVPVPADALKVYVFEDDLALRAQPDRSGALYKRLMAGSELQCLEAKKNAQAKIGTEGQWVQVQDPKGDQGYVAGWYVSTDPNAQPAPITPPPAAPPAIPAGAMTLTPIQADLALRSQTSITPETLLKRLPVTETLVVTEPAAQATPKVGVQGQWIKVKDTSGTEGYVAAWYVQLASAAPPSPPPPAPPGSPVKVKTSTEAVALRSQPLVADATLIKRLPVNSELTLLEAGAESKIGVADQWLKVKDSSGTEGYVAAWYVSK